PVRSNGCANGVPTARTTTTTCCTGATAWPSTSPTATPATTTTRAACPSNFTPCLEDARMNPGRAVIVRVALGGIALVSSCNGTPVVSPAVRLFDEHAVVTGDGASG